MQKISTKKAIINELTKLPAHLKKEHVSISSTQIAAINNAAILLSGEAIPVVYIDHVAVCPICSTPAIPGLKPHICVECGCRLKFNKKRGI